MSTRSDFPKPLRVDVLADARSRLTRSRRYFIPVCLYPHTLYRTYAGVSALFEKYELRAHDHLIVIADRLLVLDRLVTGRYWSANSAHIAARREAEQISKLIDRVSHKSGAQARGRIVFWDDIAETADYAACASRLRKEVLGDDIFRRRLTNSQDSESRGSALALRPIANGGTSVSICCPRSA